MNNNRTVQNNEKKGNLEIDRNEKINYSEDKLNQSSYNTSMSPRIKIMTEFKKILKSGALICDSSIKRLTQNLE